jgi:PAS domain S-box-containing protein
MPKSDPPWPRSSALFNYGLALLSVAVAFGGVSLLEHVLHAAPPVSLFLCVIIFVAWFAGLGPALLTTALSVLAFGYFFLLPLDSLTLASRDLPRIMLFGVAALFIASMSATQSGTAASLRRTRDQLQRAVQDLEALNRQLLLENAERTAAEQKTGQAERELQATIDMIPALVARYGPDGIIEFVNRTWQDYTGLSLESAKGRPRGVVVHPGDLPMFENAWRAHMATGEPFELEQRARRVDGQYRWHWVQRVPLRDENGSVIKWYGVGLDIHDQKQAEDALRRSETELAEARRQLQLAIDSIPVLVAAYCPDGVHDFVNQTWRDYTGLSLGDLAGDSWKTVVYPDDIAAAKRQWRACLETGTPFHAEARLRRADGEYRWHTLRRVPLRDESGAVIRWYGVGSEIEEQKRAETALQRSEAHLAEAQQELQATIDTIPTLVASYWPDGTRDSVNQAWRRFTGLLHEDVRGTKWSITVHPDDHAAGEEKWRAALAAGQPVHIEQRFRRADGEYRWHMVDRVPLRDEKGNVIRWYGVSYDIEDRKRAETALLKSEAYLDQAQRLSHTGSFGWNLASSDIVWSKEAYRILGIDRTIKPTIHFVSEHVHPDDHGIVQEEIDRVMQGADHFEYEHRWVRPDRDVKSLHVRAHRVKYESGEEEIVGALMDVTEARKAQEALNEAQVQLAHANRVATLGEMSASIAHEVNQPLAAIVANAGAGARWLTREAPDIGEALGTIRQIIGEAERAGSVIQRIRALAKKADPEMSRLDINRLIDDVLMLVRREALSHRVSLRLDRAFGLPPVYGDRIQLQQVIINLVINGIQAMATVADRPRALVIRTQRHDAGTVRVAVRDAGVGVACEDLDRLFGAFYTTKSDGMGMGLSISRSIIEAHGGRIWATRNDGPGMTFQFTVMTEPPPESMSGA